MNTNLLAVVTSLPIYHKQIINIMKKSKCLGACHSTIWENTDGCADHYRCAT